MKNHCSHSTTNLWRLIVQRLRASISCSVGLRGPPDLSAGVQITHCKEESTIKQCIPSIALHKEELMWRSSCLDNMGILHRMQGSTYECFPFTLPMLLYSIPATTYSMYTIPLIISSRHMAWSPCTCSDTDAGTTITIAVKPKDSRGHGIDLDATLGAPTGLGRAEHLKP